MLQSAGSQKVRRKLVTEQQQIVIAHLLKWQKAFPKCHKVGQNGKRALLMGTIATIFSQVFPVFHLGQVLYILKE